MAAVMGGVLYYKRSNGDLVEFGSPIEPTGDFITTESGDPLITESGDYLVQED